MVPEEPRGKGSQPDGKPDTRGSDHLDLFVAHSIFPDASAVFTCRPSPLAEVKDTACIVLDTNALLVPYGIGAQTLSEIEATYQRLLKENRLAIPAQVAREFARNRVGKLAELYQRLSRRRSQLKPFQQGGYPLLENLQEYRRLRQVEDRLDHLITEYRQLLTSVIDHVQSWEWNDPVSLLYGKLFRMDVVIDTTKPLEDIRQEHRRRFDNKIPPGYKDKAKDDQGIGDLLLWFTILEIGTVKRTSVIFVSGEEKADWWHCSEQQQLYPRFELVDEFRRVSGGCSFHIIKFSRLLELFGASTEVVAEVREEERIAAPLTSQEREILQLITEGETTREIALRLGLSTETVASQRMELMHKLDINEAAALVRYIRHGLTRP
jgi:DNA-binding CsgD family transcriptional regulator